VNALPGGFPAVEVGGGARPLVLINGGQGFVRRADPARAERDARRVARMLPPGTPFALVGYPAAPPPGASADDLADALAAGIRARWGGPVTLGGISYGGLLAARVAAREPALVDGLVLVASALRFSDDGQRRVERQIAFARAGDWAGFADDFAALARRGWLNALVRLRLWMGRHTLAAGFNAPDAITGYLHAMLKAAPPDPRAITAPTLVVGGSADQFFGDGAMAEAAAAMPDARLVLLPGETHMAPVEASKAVAATIGAFLGERVSAGVRSGR
jgi:pimeloyl-ACP methyl ester carboxylesterase